MTRGMMEYDFVQVIEKILIALCANAMMKCGGVEDFCRYRTCHSAILHCAGPKHLKFF